MQYLHRVAWAQRPVDQQRFRFDTRPIQRQRPGFPHATYIRQCLLDDHPADAVGITDFKDQVQIAIADLIGTHQRLWIGQLPILTRVFNGIGSSKRTIM
ncbi:hypothetical protein D3C78_1597070 [compost metagenome]